MSDATTASPSPPSSGANPGGPEAAFLADQLERAFFGGAWHGPAVAEAFSGIDAGAAGRRSIREAHTPWEVALHLRAWIDVARRRLRGEAVVDLAPEEDWPLPSRRSEEAWLQCLEGLEEAHRRLHRAVRGLEDARLDDPVAGSDPTVRGLLFGVLQHHAYHAGQVVVLAKANGGAVE